MNKIVYLLIFMIFDNAQSTEEKISSLLKDSSSVFWDCKTVALRDTLDQDKQTKDPFKKILMNTSPHTFSEYARKNVYPEHMIAVRSLVNLSEVIGKEELAGELYKIIKVPADNHVALEHILIDLGYSPDGLDYLTSYRMNSIKLDHYVLVSLQKVPFDPCFKTKIKPVGISEKYKKLENVVYFRHLMNGESEVLGQIIGDGYKVKDLNSGKILSVYNEQGKPIKVSEIKLGIRKNKTSPIYLKAYLK